MEERPSPRGPVLRRMLETAARAIWQRRRGLIELLLGVMVPLCALAILAKRVVHPQPPWWDTAVLSWIHAHACPTLDWWMVGITRLGVWGGVVPLSVLVIIGLLVTRRALAALFVLLAMLGTWALNDAAKAFYSRGRPALWDSPAPEQWFSFPSGHAMSSMALGTALTVLAWPTRARWPVALLSAVLVLSVGFSRLYLGVHYPSDVLGAWLASLAWVLGLRQLLLVRGRRSEGTRPAN